VKPPRIEPFQPSQRDEVVDLILPIQTEEFGVAITAADQPDLEWIRQVYQRDRGGFWVALEGSDKDGSAVVGTVGLLDFGGGGALRKMFLRKDRRGTGVGQALLETVLTHARAKALPALWLGTLETMAAAHRFYERNGFVRVGPEALPPDFPRQPVDTRFYRLPLTPAPA
jgi:GNAT superfamily N-acetyltransferase